MESSIVVNLLDLLDKLRDMENEGYDLVEISLNIGLFINDSSLNLAACSSLDGTKEQYGELMSCGYDII